jgi:hypothetical protein
MLCYTATVANKYIANCWETNSLCVYNAFYALVLRNKQIT